MSKKSFIQKDTNNVVEDDITFNGKVKININKSDIGLPNVENTSDLNKPISTAAQIALNQKSPINHTHLISGVVGLQTAIYGHRISPLEELALTSDEYTASMSASEGSITIQAFTTTWIDVATFSTPMNIDSRIFINDDESIFIVHARVGDNFTSYNISIPNKIFKIRFSSTGNGYMKVVTR